MEKDLAGSRILIVEDESPLRLLLSEFPGDEEFEVTQAESGDQAMLLLRQHGSFDLIFTDISLPGRADGNDVAAAAEQRSPGMPILYSSSSPGSLTNKNERGDAFSSKPDKLADISAAVLQPDRHGRITWFHGCGSRRAAQVVTW
jgi:CheY-like chemotaxis protein